ncbi:MAG: hypothetical protein IT443_00805 [Phycisphaeraceae bacterium]|nr:hypothetical protein [Phycisphaeraceae bacterium]
MLQKASIRQGYLVRLLILTLASLGASGWFLYDGYVKYPHNAAIFHAYKELETKNPNNPEKVDAEWKTVAAANGWPVEFKGRAPGSEHSELDIQTQKGLGYVLIPVGLLMAYFLLTHLNRWVAVDGQALLTNRGDRAEFSAIVKLDKRRWKSKGIAVAHYRHPDGSTRRIVLDDWKYDRPQTIAIEELVESRISADLIVEEQAPSTPPTPPAST